MTAEEIHNASTVVPWVMLSSIMLNGVMGFALLVRDTSLTAIHTVSDLQPRLHFYSAWGISTTR